MIDERKNLFRPESTPDMAGWAPRPAESGARSAPFFLRFWGTLFGAELLENLRKSTFRPAKRAGFLRVLGPLFEAKSLKTLVKSTFRRAKRAGFWGTLVPHFEVKSLKTLVKSTFRRAKRAGFFGGFGPPFWRRILVKIEKSWHELILMGAEKFFSAVRRVDS